MFKPLFSCTDSSGTTGETNELRWREKQKAGAMLRSANSENSWLHQQVSLGRMYLGFVSSLLCQNLFGKLKQCRINCQTSRAQVCTLLSGTYSLRFLFIWRQDACLMFFNKVYSKLHLLATFLGAYLPSSEQDPPFPQSSLHSLRHGFNEVETFLREFGLC